MDNKAVDTPKQIRSFWSRIHSWAIIALLFLANWLPRVMVIDRFVTADERSWLQRSATFFWAVQNGEWQSTFLVGHPGVTVMWSGFPAFLMRFREIADWPEMPWQSNQLEAALWQTTSPLEMLVAGRHVVVLLVSLTITAMYFPLRRLFDERLALVAVLFVGWSPFFLALSTLLHPDGLLAAFSLLSVLLLLVWLYDGRSIRFGLLSGAMMGLAALTKAPAAIIGVWGTLLMGVELIRSRTFGAHNLLRTAGEWLLWAGAAVLTFALFWPAMWVAPVDTALRVFAQSQYYAGSGHEIQSYFLSKVVSDPGGLFYPIAYLMRVSPLSLIGLVVAAWAWRRRYAPFERSSVRRSLAALVGFALLFSLVMAIGAKKFDRYILPAMLALDVVTAAGWYGVVSHMAQYRTSARINAARFTNLSLLCIVVIHGAMGLSRYPYYGTYYNPLVGGARLAPRVLMVGWGEGLDQAARWIDAQNNKPLTVVSWYEEGPLSYFLPSDTKTLSFIESDHYWFDADYLVLYQNQVQRNNPDIDMINHFLSQPADYVVRHGGLDLVWVYDLANHTPPPFTGIHVDTAAPVTDAIDLVAYRVEAEAVTPGENAQITLFLESDALIEEDLLSETALTDAAGQVVWQERRRPGGIPTVGWQAREVREDSYSIPIPPDAAAGEYALSTRLVDAQNQPFEQDGHYAAPIVVQQPEVHYIETTWDPPELSVASLSHASSLAPGQSLLVDIVLDGAFDPTAKLSLRLSDIDGKTWAQMDKYVAPNIRFELETQGDVPSGTFGVDAVLYDGESLEAYTNQYNDGVSRLSTIEIR